MKKILIISNYWHFDFERASSRYETILNILSRNPAFDVELITSNFKHSTKSQRNYPESRFKDCKYSVNFIQEPGYQKNVSIKRIRSHKIFATNLKKYLETKKDVDIVYSFVPSLSANKAIADYCREKHIKYVIDVLDLWPEAFRMAVKIPVLDKVLFYPMKKEADYIYASADAIVAVSESYLQRALDSNKKNVPNACIYIGTDLKTFDSYKSKSTAEKNNDSIIKIVYIGTQGNSYDIKTIIDAIKLLNEKGFNNLKFVLIGDGPLRSDFETYAKERNVDCDFTGNLPYGKMVKLLCSCDIAVNPIVKNAYQSITNKICDYAASGRPVINTQMNNEYRELIDKYHAGLNCNCGDPIDVSKKLEILIKDSNLRKRLGKGNRKLAEERFDRIKAYRNLEKIIEGLYQEEPKTVEKGYSK